MADTTLKEDRPPLDMLVARYVKLRDALKQADEDHKTKTKPAREYLDRLNSELLGRLQEIGTDNAKTAGGTVYRTMKKSASLADAAAFRKFVLEQQAFDLVDWRANAPAIEAFINENAAPPPGVNFSTVFVVGVRRPATE